MKLYVNPFACSLASHIALIESGLPFTVEWVDLKSRRTADGADYLAINAKAMVPALALDDGRVLTESVAVLLAIADRAPAGRLAAAAGSAARDHQIEVLSFLATEIHARTLGPWITAGSSSLPREAFVAHQRGLLKPRLDHLEALAARDRYLCGASFSIADAYLVAMLNWVRHLKIALDEWPKLAALGQRLAAHPSVQQAFAVEAVEYRKAA